MDTTLRDAHQSLWATRMTTAMMLSVADRMDRAGFDAIDLSIGGAHVDVSVRYLKENPWERVRLLCKNIYRTPMYGTVRSKSGAAFDVVPNDIPLLWIERLIANGMRRFRIYDALADLDNIVYLLRHAKELGAYTVGILAYGHSPVHTDELYARKTKELIERAAVDAIMIKDAGGLLTPDRIRTLVPAMKGVMGNLPLELHSHCLTGLAPLVYLDGVKLGVDQLHTAIAPLANGEAQPATQTMVRNLRDMGYAVNVDDALIDEVGEHFRKVAEQEGLPLGVPMEYDAFHFEHQVPGGMQTNFKFQLAQAGLTHKLDEVLHECARIRGELGWPIMITPFSQFVGTLAVLNVVNGERYKVIPDEVKKYALGYYGKLMAPVQPDILDRILSNGSRSIALTPPELEPAVPALRRKYPNISDEERLLRYSYAGSQVDDMLAAGAMRTEYHFEQPWVRLLKEISKLPRLTRVHIQKKDLIMDLHKQRAEKQTEMSGASS
ncbi:MAG: pyruvate carboxylase subunit B [Betaproteobacteria bacterium]|nr:pyruvate carboxylase subunit B [Betaproteobacteria bacterium]